MKGIRKHIEEEDSKDYSDAKAFFADVVQECLEVRLKQENNDDSDDKTMDVDEGEDFKIALQLQQEEEFKSSNRLSLRRRASGINRKYQEGLIIKPSKRKSEADSAAETGKPKSGRVLNKPLLLSPEMAAVFDNQFTELTRPEVVKKLWEYIKEHNLQDPSDKRFILCDDKLMNVFNRSRVNCFKMAKFMSAHLHRKEDLSGVDSVQSSPKSVKVSKKSETNSTLSSPKKQKISNACIEDSDDEASDFLQGVQMNPLLLKVPGVTPEMTYSAVQSAILAYTQVMKLRDSKDPDVIIVKPNTPIAQLMNNNKRKVHILDLIERVHFLFDNKNEK